jgi:hypothetical protein
LEGDFLESAGPRDILDALGLEPGVEAVLRSAQTPEEQMSALLLGAFLSGAGASDTGGLGTESETEEELRVEQEGELRAEAEEPEAEVVAEVRVTAVEEVQAYLRAEQRAHLAGERPEFTPATYVPRLHFFEPTGMVSYTPVRTDYPEEMILRDRASHISSGWAQVTSNNFNF